MNSGTIATRVSRRGALALAFALAAVPAAHAWNAEGTVRTTTGGALAGVAVTVKDSSSYTATTGANGAFSVMSSTGILERTGLAGMRIEGSDLVVEGVTGSVELALVDASGKTLWSARATLEGGSARARLPERMGARAVFLRARTAEGVAHQAILVGADGWALQPSVAARGFATYPVLQFKKTGYRDTTYAMTSASQTGLSIVMKEEGSSTTCPTTKLSPVDKLEKSITVKGVTRKFLLHVPSGYTGTTPVPLLVDYHPIGGSAQGQFGGTTYKSQVDKDGGISVYPDGMTGPMGQAWNVKGCCTTADDTAFARALVAEVKKIACINPKRVYAAGFSMGGGMTHFSACHLADIFAAGAPAAFDLTEQNVPTCKPSRPITMVMFRGTKDPIVMYEGGHSAVVSGMAIDFLGAKKTAAKWAELNKCTGSPSAEDANGCSTYSNCGSGVQVTLCTKQGGGHDQGNGSIGWPILKKYTLP